MTFIRTVAPAEAEGPVREMYRQAEEQFGFVPNWTRAFSLRPEVKNAWTGLVNAVKANLSLREFELATLAAARALHSSYCCLVHGRVLADKVFDAATVTAIAAGTGDAALEPRERAMMAFIAKLARQADQISAADVDELRRHGYRDEQIFDLAAAGAARCFFSTLLDALGVQADARLRGLDPALREALTVGREPAE